MNKIKTIAFFVSMLLMLAVPIYMVASYEAVLKRGTTFSFTPRPIDPFDAFRGRYVILRFDQEEISHSNAENTFKAGDEVFLELIKGSHDETLFGGLSHHPYEQGDYLRVRVRYVWDDKVGISFPFDRYYMNEDLAPEAERMLGWAGRDELDSLQVTVNVKVRDGEGMIDGMYVNGQTIEDYLKTIDKKE